MENLRLFCHNDFGSLSVLTVGDDKILFPASECAEMLGYVNPRDAIARHCKTEGVVKHDSPTEGGIQSKNYITEGNLYRLIVHSNLPAAERFERWVFDEVLPTVRKHGAYMTPEKLEEALLNPDTLIRLASDLKAEREKRLEAEERVKELAPKAVFADAVSASGTSILIGDLAKLLKQNGVDMGQQRLFEWLRNNGWLIKNGSSRNLPTQRAMELGLFEVKESTFTNSDGSIRITRTTKVLGKGQTYFVNAFLSGKVKLDEVSEK